MQDSEPGASRKKFPSPATHHSRLTGYRIGLLGCLVATALAGCGGGHADDTSASAGSDSTKALAVNPDAGERTLAGPEGSNPGGWVTVPVQADPLLEDLAIPADAAEKGMWSQSKSWPLNGLHVALLPNGRVLSFGSTPDGYGQNGRYFDVWDPAQGFTAASHQTSYDPERQDSFCGTATFLADGRLMISGGNGSTTSTLYRPSSNLAVRSPASMGGARWYATMITLPDGRPLMLGGMAPYAEDMQYNPALAIAQGKVSMTPEVFENNAWRSLFGAYSRTAFGPDYLRASYPRAFVAPSGEVFGISADQMWYLDPAGNGTLREAGMFKRPYSAAAAPVNVGATNTAVMYAPGRILVVGGNGGFNGDGLPASDQATAIDINGAGPILTEQPAMNFARRFPNAVVLADGKVVVTGGTKRGNRNGGDAVYAAEIWNPSTSTWHVGANARIYRGYHSFSILLPNGTVLSTGGGAPGPVTNLNAEVYYPPHLFRAVSGGAQLAPRPVMAALSGLSYANGAMLQVDMSSSAEIPQLVLIGTGNGTHSFNSGQRRIPLGVQQSGKRLTAMLPGNTIAPPGYYQLVAIDAEGVPSQGTLIAIGQNVSQPPVAVTPYKPPTLDVSVDAPLIAVGGTANFKVAPIVGTTYSWDFGDGTPETAFVADPEVQHLYGQAGVYAVILSARAPDGSIARRRFVQGVASPATGMSPTASNATALEARGASSRLWVANPDNDSVSVIDTATNTRVAEIGVGKSPRSVATAPNGRVWVTNKGSATISIVDPGTLAVVQTVALPRASQPHGLSFMPGGNSAFVVLEAGRQLLRLDAVTGARQGAVAVGENARHVSISGDAATVLVSRFITPPLSGESTAMVKVANGGGEVLVVDPASMAVTRTVMLRHSEKTDAEIQGSGIPNYLAAAVISPDGKSAWVPSKQDNVTRGTLRNGLPLDFQNTVRAISSRIDMATLAEDHARRIDHDNASLGSAAAFTPDGVYLFVALETSRQVAVIDAAGGRELFKLDAGRAPQGVNVSADGKRLYVQNFMDRSVSVLDLGPLLTLGELRAPLLATVGTVGADRLPAQVLLGKQLFYDARDQRLARDSYMSCASCHNDAGHDGRVWDFTGTGEGLRKTISLKGRSGTGHGFLHGSANFDEVQDFEQQIRQFAGGTGLMSDADFNTGTRRKPLGDRKAGISPDLDALAAYLASLNTFAPSPYRNADGTFTAAATAGKRVFQMANCASCHGGASFTVSAGANALKNIGTIKATSGLRLGAPLTGLDIPTLRDIWAGGPYLHDGSAATLAAAVQAHSGNRVAGNDLATLTAYLQQIGSEEAPARIAPPADAATCAVERKTCSLPATRIATVWYGANDNWTARTGVSGRIACNNATFGDPLFGTFKSCRYLVN